jgi:ATP-binding cassette subfamily B protein/subfamily B ATP-binding cassette protein MsbA
MEGLAPKVLRYVRPYRWRFTGALAQVLLLSGIELLKPWPMQIVVDGALGGHPPSLLAGLGWSPLVLAAVACAALALIHMASGAITVWYNWRAIGLGQLMVSDLRGQLYGHLQRLSLAFHGRQRVGDLMLRITGDSYAVQTMIMNGLLPIVSALCLLVGMLAVLAPLDPLLTAVSLAIVPLLFVLIGQFNRRIERVATQARDHDSEVYSVVQWGMGAIRHVQAFTKEAEEHRRFMAASGAALSAHRRLYAWQSAYSAVINAIVAVGTALVLLVGAREVLIGTLTVGQLLVFISYLAQLYAPVNQITQSWGLIAGARVGALRCFEVLETVPDLADGTITFPPEGATGKVAWRGVGFSYRSETPVLRGIDLVVEAGETVALVGATGAGKSTMLGLLPRFFDPVQGSVEIDGIDLRHYRLESLRRQISLVLQPPLVFPSSIRDNIAYGRPDATLAEIQAAARHARIDRLIEVLPQGWDTIIGESGASLSEGEKQRLTIARAILRNAPILILDEPTSALDVETEAAVMKAIEALAAGRTTFVIAHRLSTIRRADRILVLKDGVLAESGNFAELMQRGKIFATLYATQFGTTEDASASA